MKINGLELPVALEIKLRAGHHKLSPNQSAHLKAALTRISNPEPIFESYKSIVRENQIWKKPHSKYYLGNMSSQYLPGNIDRERTLIIGGAEPDSPIALDYRHDDPSVIYFCEIDHVSYWVELCRNYEALLKIIGDE